MEQNRMRWVLDDHQHSRPTAARSHAVSPPGSKHAVPADLQNISSPKIAPSSGFSEGRMKDSA
ncbi:hypothetical protein EYF80_059915 [Liparis tanakae]|uniref:Uncharacterized protein n=1 Tax=Liparis tanakae TaxID=230148 RepID=A0A4Z2EM15_9TELE|nr:hypothetical protein EYF80_059915 [Liparis tanakae]